MDPNLNAIPCPVCGAVDPVEVDGAPNLVRDHYGLLPRRRTWVQCRTCSLYYVADPPSADALTYWWAGNDNRHGNHANCPANFTHQELLIQEERIKAAGIPSSATGARLLELGCGWGEFLSAAASLTGMEAWGVEVSAKRVKWCHKLGLNVSRMEALAYFDHPARTEWDYIVAWELLEHHPEPVRLLCAMEKALPNGGQFVGNILLATPLTDHPFSEFYGFNNPMWLVPDHRMFFTSEALEYALMKAGLRVTHSWYSRKYFGSLEMCLVRHSYGTPA